MSHADHAAGSQACSHVTAGFEAVELHHRAQIDVPADPIGDWETLKRVAPNPLVPTYDEVIAAALNDDERERLDTYMNALAAAGTPTRRTMATAFLRARRPQRNREDVPRHPALTDAPGTRVRKAR
ncbi:hypothetical protein AB0J84_11300 [Micromonospora arborensis]|uniref:hypothetical protein n=1 Tax=Micromonospora arborensis TaxID=2116518 RepID=UPI003429BC73